MTGDTRGRWKPHACTSQMLWLPHTQEAEEVEVSGLYLEEGVFCWF